MGPAPARASIHTAGAPEGHHGYRVTAARGMTAFPAQDITLRRPTAAQAARAVDAATAYAAATSNGPLVDGADAAGLATATLSSYSNSVAGTIQPDGGVVLEYRSVPAWVFDVPLRRYLDQSVGGASVTGQPFLTPTGSECSMITIVDARHAAPIEAFETCVHWRPGDRRNPPAPHR